jgi:hypothetical protein
MKRRAFVQAIPLTALLPTGLSALTGSAEAASSETSNSGAQASGQPSSGSPGTGTLPDYAKNFLTSDMDGVGPDGKPTGQKSTHTGASKGDAKPGAALQQMALNQEEKYILDGN